MWSCRKSGFIIWGISLGDFMAINLMVVDIFQSGPNGWFALLTDVATPRAMLQAWLKIYQSSL